MTMIEQIARCAHCSRNNLRSRAWVRSLATCILFAFGIRYCKFYLLNLSFEISIILLLFISSIIQYQKMLLFIMTFHNSNLLNNQNTLQYKNWNGNIRGFEEGSARGDLRSHVAEKVSHKPHLFFGANVVYAHFLQSQTVLLHAPSSIHEENCPLILLVFTML